MAIHLLINKDRDLQADFIKPLYTFFYVCGVLFRGEITPLSSSYNIPGLVPGVLVTFSMLLTETSEISKSLLHMDLSGDKCFN